MDRSKAPTWESAEGYAYPRQCHRVLGTIAYREVVFGLGRLLDRDERATEVRTTALVSARYNNQFYLFRDQDASRWVRFAILASGGRVMIVGFEADAFVYCSQCTRATLLFHITTDRGRTHTLQVCTFPR